MEIALCHNSLAETMSKKAACDFQLDVDFISVVEESMYSAPLSSD